MGTEIAFLTLFLGLVHGARPVVLSAGPQVAAIEVLLDDKKIATLEHAPWETAVDFGPALLPHHLVARALDAGDHPLAHTEQWVNLPIPLVAAQILMEGDSAPVRTAHVVAASFSGQPATELHLEIDGQPVKLDSQGRGKVTLPAVGAASVLTARAVFPGNVEARSELVLTSDDASGVKSELTAVPVRTPRQEKTPRPPDSLRGRFVAAGQPLDVYTVQQEAAHVFIVRGHAFARDMKNVLTQIPWRRAWRQPELGLPYQFHYVAPAATIYRSKEGTAEEFNITKSFDYKGIFYKLLLLTEPPPTQKVGRQRLTDAVAAAAVHALGYQTRRAVVLLLGAKDAAEDFSDFTPAMVRAYMKATGVPLYVWTPGNPAPFAAWGDVVDISSPQALDNEEARLTGELNAQQIVWLRGRYLPQDITLAPAADRKDDLTLLVGLKP